MEELMKKDLNPIIVVPASDTPGNVCLKNVVKFLNDGRYQGPKDVQQTDEEKYEAKKVFTHRIGNQKEGH